MRGTNFFLSHEKACSTRVSFVSICSFAIPKRAPRTQIPRADIGRITMRNERERTTPMSPEVNGRVQAVIVLVQLVIKSTDGFINHAANPIGRVTSTKTKPKTTAMPMIARKKVSTLLLVKDRLDLKSAIALIFINNLYTYCIQYINNPIDINQVRGTIEPTEIATFSILI